MILTESARNLRKPGNAYTLVVCRTRFEKQPQKYVDEREFSENTPANRADDCSASGSLPIELPSVRGGRQEKWELMVIF
jgi:hypothetical protein